jgi:hypothetical protein
MDCIVEERESELRLRETIVSSCVYWNFIGTSPNIFRTVSNLIINASKCVRTTLLISTEYY